MQSLNSGLSVWIIDHSENNYHSCLIHKDLLSIEEQRQADGYHFERDRISYIISHIALRRLISHYTRIPPNKINFTKNNFGKPYIDYEGLYFNLSHTTGKTIIGFFNQEIGIDIEYLDQELDIDELIPLIMSNKEQKILKQLQAPAKKNMFIKLWTRKEALLKAIGSGIHDDITTLDVSNLKYFNNKLPASRPLQWKIASLNTNDKKYYAHVAYNSAEKKEITYNKIDFDKILSVD
jgi:4'-phosphopantetheinyl transferase